MELFFKNGNFFKKSLPLYIEIIHYLITITHRAKRLHTIKFN